jgi:hypothetical protein
VTTTLGPMRRWLAMLLLVLLPLQFSWAAVASYCEHDTRAPAEHAGHDHVGHDHGTPVADGGDHDQAESASSSVSSVDCGHCHGHCAGMIDVGLSPDPQTLGSEAPPSGDTVRAEHLPVKPERPQWARLA